MLLTLLATVLLAPAPARATPVSPTSQTLEALRGAQGDDGGRVFDGYEKRVRTVSPIGYAPLPAAPAPVPTTKPTEFDSHRVAPVVVVHSPAVPRPAASRAGSYAALGGGVLLAAAGLIAGGSLLLPLAGVGAALILVGALMLLR